MVVIIGLFVYYFIFVFEEVNLVQLYDNCINFGLYVGEFCWRIE